MSNRHYKVLTEKGLRYILNTSTNLEAIAAVKLELAKRGIRLTHLKSQTSIRELDGYEKDK